MQAVQKRPRSVQARNYLVAVYQTQRNAVVVLLTLLVALYVLTGPNQADDMIDAVIDTGVFSRLFGYILLTAFVWSWVMYGSTRLILHISPVGIRLNAESDQLLRWLPKLGGMMPTLILAYAFWQPTHWHLYLLLGESGLMLTLFLRVERHVRVFRLPARWTFPERYTSFRQDIRTSARPVNAQKRFWTDGFSVSSV